MEIRAVAHVKPNKLQVPLEISPGINLCNVQPEKNRQAEEDSTDETTSQKSTQTLNYKCQLELTPLVVERASRGMNHVEGGWPVDIDPTDVESTARYRKKAEKEEGFISAVLRTAPILEECILQNTSLDMYQSYFDPESNQQSLSVDLITDETSIKTTAVLRFPFNFDVSVNDLSSGTLTTSNNIVVAYIPPGLHAQCSLRFTTPLPALLWDIEVPYKHCLELFAPFSVDRVVFNDREPTLVACAGSDGRPAVFDVRSPCWRPDSMAELDKGHTMPVSDLTWCGNKAVAELCTVAADGEIKWWDTRRLSCPVESIDLGNMVSAKEKRRRLIGLSSVETDQSQPSRFTVGTRQGHILTVTRTVGTGDEVGRVALKHSSTAHLAAVTQIERNQILPTSWLSLDEHCLNVWSDDIRSEPLFTIRGRVPLYSAVWSVTRPSMYFVADHNGVLQVWDLLYHTHRPVSSLQIRDAALTRVSYHADNCILAVGSADATVSMVTLPHQYTNISKQERQTLTTMLDREVRKEKAVETRLREERANKLLKENQENIEGVSSKSGSSKRHSWDVSSIDKLWEKSMAETEALYNDIVKQNGREEEVNAVKESLQQLDSLIDAQRVDVLKNSNWLKVRQFMSKVIADSDISGSSDHEDDLDDLSDESVQDQQQQEQSHPTDRGYERRRSSSRLLGVQEHGSSSPQLLGVEEHGSPSSQLLGVGEHDNPPSQLLGVEEHVSSSSQLLDVEEISRSFSQRSGVEKTSSIPPD